MIISIQDMCSINFIQVSYLGFGNSTQLTIPSPMRQYSGEFYSDDHDVEQFGDQLDEHCPVFYVCIATLELTVKKPSFLIN